MTSESAGPAAKQQILQISSWLGDTMLASRTASIPARGAHSPSEAVALLTVGPSAACDLALKLRAPRVLVSSTGGGAIAHLRAEDRARLFICGEDGEATTLLPEGDVPIPKDATLSLALGDVRITISSEPAPLRLPAKPVLQLDLVMLRSIISTCVFFVGLFLIAAAIPTDEVYLGSEELSRASEERQRKARATLATIQAHAKPAAQMRRSAPRVEPLRPVDPPLEPALYAPIQPPQSREEAAARAPKSGFLPTLSALLARPILDDAPKIRSTVSERDIELLGDHHPSQEGQATDAWGYGVTEVGKGPEYETVKAKYALATAKQRGRDFEKRAYQRQRPREMQASDPAPAVSESTATIIASGVPWDAVRGQLGMRRAALARCFSSSGSVSPGALTLSFDIGSDGALLEPVVDEASSEAVRVCLAEKLARVRFPREEPGEAIEVRGFALRI